MNNRTLIIAEAGVNHNGSVEIAKKICNAAKSSGADVVKFQTWITENIITKNVEKAGYQVVNTKSTESQFDMLKKLELSQDDFREIKEYCESIGITFASTADDKESLDFLIKLGIPFIKVGSGEICNIPYLRYIGSKNLPVILSTGMSSLEDVRISIEALKSGGAQDITLLHCTSSYPCPFSNVNLKAMDTLAKEFNLRVGYSDHTKGIEVAIAAVSRGATVVEKHFTLDCAMEGPDHLSSTEPQDFKKMVEAIRNVEIALGNGIKAPTNEELVTSKVVLKRIVAKTQIKKGTVFSEKNLTIKRAKDGLSAKEWDSVVGNIANRDFEIDEGIYIDEKI